MKLTTFLAPDATTPTAGEVRDDQVVAFTDAASIKDRLAEGSGPADGECWPLAGVTLLAPVQSPGAIYCVALNYKRHIEETGFKAPDRPFIFLKQPGSSVPGNGTARRPSIVQKLDYEGELAVVIGAGGRVGGYAVANDLSARDLQRVEPHWTRAKGADDFCPWGPWVTTADEVSDPENLTLRTWVNGELRQNSTPTT